MTIIAKPVKRIFLFIKNPVEMKSIIISPIWKEPFSNSDNKTVRIRTI